MNESIIRLNSYQNAWNQKDGKDVFFEMNTVMLSNSIDVTVTCDPRMKVIVGHHNKQRLDSLYVLQMTLFLKKQKTSDRG
jgi:hypothetical protein